MHGHGAVEQLYYTERVTDLGGPADESHQVIFEEVKFIEEDDVPSVLVFQPGQIQRFLPIEETVKRFVECHHHQPNLWTPLEGDTGKERLDHQMIGEPLVRRAIALLVVRAEQGSLKSI